MVDLMGLVFGFLLLIIKISGVLSSLIIDLLIVSYFISRPKNVNPLLIRSLYGFLALFLVTICTMVILPLR